MALDFSRAQQYLSDSQQGAHGDVCRPPYELRLPRRPVEDGTPRNDGLYEPTPRCGAPTHEPTLKGGAPETDEPTPRCGAPRGKGGSPVTKSIVEPLLVKSLPEPRPTASRLPIRNELRLPRRPVEDGTPRNDGLYEPTPRCGAPTHEPTLKGGAPETDEPTPRCWAPGGKGGSPVTKSIVEPLLVKSLPEPRPTASRLPIRNELRLPRRPVEDGTPRNDGDRSWG